MKGLDTGRELLENCRNADVAFSHILYSSLDREDILYGFGVHDDPAWALEVHSGMWCACMLATPT